MTRAATSTCSPSATPPTRWSPGSPPTLHIRPTGASGLQTFVRQMRAATSARSPRFRPESELSSWKLEVCQSNENISADPVRRVSLQTLLFAILIGLYPKCSTVVFKKKKSWLGYIRVMLKIQPEHTNNFSPIWIQSHMRTLWCFSNMGSWNTAHQKYPNMNIMCLEKRYRMRLVPQLKLTVFFFSKVRPYSYLFLLSDKLENKNTLMTICCRLQWGPSLKEALHSMPITWPIVNHSNQLRALIF